jgi:hypothetical protein
MTTNAAKIELLEAHNAMASVLDVKLGNMPEWKAFRAIDRALIALEVASDSPKPKPFPILPKPNQARTNETLGYVELTRRLLDSINRPVTTGEVVNHISQFRQFPDLEKAKVNITSSLSKDPRFRSIVWDLKKVWWWTDKDPPPIPNGQALPKLPY